MFKKVVVFLLFVLLVPLFSGCATNPVSGKGQLMFISPGQGLLIGQKYAPEIEKQLGGKIANGNLQNYINNVAVKSARAVDLYLWRYS